MQFSSPYIAYTYAYPHKTAYRPLPPRPLTDVWADEPADNLFLYIHIPFCEMRCGFCNLFTTTNPAESLTHSYLDALWRQAERMREAVPNATIAQVAIGGGTPTYLDIDELQRVLDIPKQIFDVDLTAVPVSVETSPETATPDRLALLREHGTDRISIGVQSFVKTELNGIGRPQRNETVHRALHNLSDFHTRNIDLIYGNPGQTEASWLDSLRAALEISPEQLYLYPLYVRPLTGMSKMRQAWDDQRMRLYQCGRTFLLNNGYRQLTMRHFQHIDHTPQMSADYACQEDGMIGLGCGARSYTERLHYSSAYAVGRTAVRDILQAWCERDFECVDYGFVLDDDEQQRRYMLKSLLSSDGLDSHSFTDRFGIDLIQKFPLLTTLTEYIRHENGRYHLTEKGIAWSDAVGTLFYSEHVQARSQTFALT